MKHILAIAPNWIGDAAMCTPALRALAKRLPDAELTVAGKASICGLLSGLPYIHHVEPIPASASLPTMIRTGRALAAHSADAAIIFPHSARAALLAVCAGSRRRVGYARGGRSGMLTDRVAPHRVNGHIEPIYMAREYLELVAILGCTDDGEGLELHADSATVSAIGARVAGSGPLIGIAPGAAFGPSKLWPAERYAAVADALAERSGARCVLLTGPGEEDVRDAVTAAAKRPLLRVDDNQPTIDTLKATVSLLDLLICNDSGTRHVAVAFKVPTISILGPTSPAYSCGRYERGEMLRVDVDCGPCQRPVCSTDHRCMTRISVDRVVEAAYRQLHTQL